MVIKLKCFSVDEVEENGKKAIDMLSKIAKTSDDFSKKVAAWNSSMIDKIEALRNKITKAHQIADGVILFMFCPNFL